MKLNTFLTVGILFEAALTVQSGLLSNLLGGNCYDWRKGVQDCRSGVERVVRKFPQPTYDFGQSILASFNAQIDSLQDLTNNTSPILANRSTNLLEALSLLSKVDNTPTNLLYQVEKTLSSKSAAYRSLVANLTEMIGELDTPVNNVITSVQNSIATCLKQFNKRFSVRRQDRSEKIDFKDMVKSARLNMFTISFIAETALNSGEQFSTSTFEAIAILTFISNLQVLATHGVNANMGSVLVSETDNVSPFLRLCFEALNPLVGQITQLVSSSTFESVDKTKTYLADFVKIINSYEGRLANLLGPFEGVDITEAKVNQNLAKGQSEGNNTNAESAATNTNAEDATTNTNAEGTATDTNAEGAGTNTDAAGAGGDPTTSQSDGSETSAN
ncbi:uncharacterized protein LOC119069571 isoform X2 [Bradysia coprophila]|uniref:uncharacterized protein LOC119069571 isoform X2 n=1 Tax=Bradysia coprophila TaxID=38358 RepID=UPI00187DD4F7|nr:uncharacterized protein LOC119069571 isoform X2 [Bradysia coprophila]